MSATYIACMGIMQTENGLKIKINYTGGRFNLISKTVRTARAVYIIIILRYIRVPMYIYLCGFYMFTIIRTHI